MNFEEMSEQEYEAWQARERAAFKKLCEEDPLLEAEILNDWDWECEEEEDDELL